jgi:phage terminase small subunit
MAPPRKPTSVLAAAGAFEQNPSRAAGRGADAKPSGDLGPCPDYLGRPERECWEQVVRDAAPGALTNADNFAVEALSRLMAIVKSGQATAAIYAQLGQYLDRFGMNPKSRANVQIPKTKTGNAFADLTK